MYSAPLKQGDTMWARLVGHWLRRWPWVGSVEYQLGWGDQNAANVPQTPDQSTLLAQTLAGGDLRSP